METSKSRGGIRGWGSPSTVSDTDSCNSQVFLLSTLSLKLQWGSQTRSLKMIVSIDRRDKTTLHMMVTGPKAHAHIHQTSALLPILDSVHQCPVLPLVWIAFLVGALNLHFFGQNSCLQCFHWVLCMHAKLVQSCPTLCDPMDCSPPGSPVHGILQATMLEWVAISFSNAWKWKVKVKSLSRVRLLATSLTAAYQAPP